MVVLVWCAVVVWCGVVWCGVVRCGEVCGFYRLIVVRLWLK